jgi:chemotaxis signal transduction protein
MTAALFTPRETDEVRRTPSAFVPAPAPAAEPTQQPAPPAPAAVEAPALPAEVAEIAAPTGLDGYVVFSVGRTSFAVPVAEVREVLRAARIELLPDSGREVNGRSLALVDARGRSIPVLDLRSSRSAPGDVLIPMWRHHVGVVVDRVVSVRSPRELVRETEDVPVALPSYARGVLRPVDGGAPVLLIAMPDAPELEADARRVDEPRLGEDVLGAVDDDDLIIAS